MKLFYTEHFRQGYESAPPHIQRAFDRRAALLVQNLRHPSLHAKKYDKQRGIWQARVNGGWRFYFIIEGNIYRLLSIRPHPK